MANTNNDKRGNIKTIRPNFMWIWAAVVMIIIGYSFFSGGDSKPVTSDWYTVADMIRNGEVQRIKVMNKNTALVYLTPEAIEKYRASDDERYKRMPRQGEQLTFTIGSVDILDRDVNNAIAESTVPDNPVRLEYANERTGWGDIVLNLLPWVFLIGVYIVLIRSM